MFVGFFLSVPKCFLKALCHDNIISVSKFVVIIRVSSSDKILGGKRNEWVLSLGRLWDVFWGKFLDASRLLLGNFLRQKQNISSLILCIVVIL